MFWMRGIFNEQALATDGTETQMVVVDGTDWSPAVAGINKQTRLRRLIIRGGVSASMLSTTLGFDIIAMYSMLYKQDTEDTDTGIITPTVGGILQAGTVLWQDAKSMTGLESPTGNIAVLPQMFRWSIDIRVRLPLRSEDELILGFQPGSSVTGTIAAWAASFYVSALFEQVS